MIKLLFLFLIVCLFVRVIDHGVNEGEPVDEQCCEQVNEGPFRDPEPEGQCFDQDLRRLRRRQVQSHPLMHAFVLVFINTTYWPVL